MKLLQNAGSDTTYHERHYEYTTTNKETTTLREEAKSALTGYRASPLYRLKWNLECWFLWKGKTVDLGEKLSEQGENRTQTRPTDGTGPEPNPGHIGRAFSKTRLPPEFRRVLSCQSLTVFLHTPLEEKGP